jgi:hypothetical protein
VDLVLKGRTALVGYLIDDTAGSVTAPASGSAQTSASAPQADDQLAGGTNRSTVERVPLRLGEECECPQPG